MIFLEMEDLPTELQNDEHRVIWGYFGEYDIATFTQKQK